MMVIVKAEASVRYPNSGYYVKKWHKSYYYRADCCYGPLLIYPTVPADRVSRSMPNCNGVGC